MMELPKTHWIWVPDLEEKLTEEPRLVYFRKSFSLTEVPESLKIRISADTRYKLYVNGIFAEFGPARGDEKIWFADEVELAPYLQQGENVLAAEVLRYPLAYRYGNFGMLRTATPGLFIEELSGGNTVSADDTWRCKTAEGFHMFRENPGYAPLFYLEEREGQPQDQGWRLPDFDDGSWSRAFARNVMEVPTGSCPGDLNPRPIPYMKKEKRQFLNVMPNTSEPDKAQWERMLTGDGEVSIPANSSVRVEINAGEEMCGFLSLRMRGGKGAEIKVLTSEGYVQEGFAPGGREPLKADRCDYVNGHLDGFTDTYHAAGGEDAFEPYWFRTFRFVRLDIQTGEEPLSITGFDYLETGYPLEAVSHVETSDPTLAPVWDISLRTLKRCMHETYYDCPFYEQLQYAMDSRSEILYTYAVSADDRLARQCMDDFRRSQRADGMINCCYPHYGPNIIPGFSIYYILMVHDHMMFFGDKTLVRKHLGAIDGILNYFDAHLESRGLVGKTGGRIEERYWSFIDWAIPWGRTVGMPPAGLVGPITMESLLYLYGLQTAAELCRYVGRTDTAAEYEARAARLAAALKEHCRDGEGIYLDGPGVKEYSQHCQVFAVLTGLLSPEEARPILEKTLEDKEKYAQCTVAMAFYLYRALEKADLYERTDGLWDIWRAMIKNHVTTCVESPVGQRSDCHAWGSLALYELPTVALGVHPGAPGYETIVISPKAGALSGAKGTVATKWGPVFVEWKKQPDGSLDLTYTADEAVKARIRTE